MNSYLINLKRRPDRLAESLAEFAKTNIKPIVVEGVDGKLIFPFPTAWAKAGDGALGCSLAHRKVLADAIANGEDAIMVFEDDFTLCDKFDEKLEEFLKIVPNDWDAILLGGQHKEPPYTTSVPGVIRAENIHRTHSYIIRGEYLKFMYEKWNTETRHIDHTWGEHQKDWKVYSPYPKWFVCQRESKSDINGRDLKERCWHPKRVRTSPTSTAKASCVPCARKRQKSAVERQVMKEAARAARRKQREEAQAQRRLKRQQRLDAVATRTTTELPAPIPSYGPNFSIVLPSRERVELLTQLLASIQKTASHITKIEVLVGIDKDDTHTMNAVNDLQTSFPFVSFYVGARCPNLSAGYYNPLAKASTGRYVMLLNDDTEFTKPGWDTEALTVLDDFRSNHPDNIGLGKIADNTGCSYSCFPVLSRETIKALGYAQQQNFTSWGADVFISRVFQPLGREVALPIPVNHYCHHNNTRQRDHINKQMARNSKQPYHLVDSERARLQQILLSAQQSSALA